MVPATPLQREAMHRRLIYQLGIPPWTRVCLHRHGMCTKDGTT